MRGRLLVVAVTCLMLGADGPKEDAVKEEVAKLQGSWIVISQTNERAMPADRKFQKIIIKDAVMTIVMQRFNTVEEFTIDPSKSPKEMDQIIAEGPHKGEIMRGIYELNGDNLILCYHLNSKIKDRPSEFKDNQSYIRLVVLKREKPEKP